MGLTSRVLKSSWMEVKKDLAWRQTPASLSSKHPSSNGEHPTESKTRTLLSACPQTGIKTILVKWHAAASFQMLIVIWPFLDLHFLTHVTTGRQLLLKINRSRFKEQVLGLSLRVLFFPRVWLQCSFFWSAPHYLFVCVKCWISAFYGQLLASVNEITTFHPRS